MILKGRIKGRWSFITKEVQERPKNKLVSCSDLLEKYMINRLLKKAHLLRCPHPSSLRRISIYASLLRISGRLVSDPF
jgi:hypothetical protein